MEIINLDMVPGKKSPVCHASQYDDGRVIRFNLYDSGLPFTLDGTETVTFEVRKPDGNIVISTLTNTSDSYVDVVTTEQMTAVKGANLCEMRVEKGGTNIGSLNVIMAVEMDPTDGGIASASEIDNLRSQVSGMVAEEVAEQYDAGSVIFDSAPTPGHGNGYAVTSEGVATALGSKADRSELPDMSNYYNKTETDTLLDDKADVSDLPDMSNYYTKTETDTALDDKADSDNVYSKTQVDNKFTALKEWKTSTTSFVDACSQIGIYQGIGNTLDNLKAAISTFQGNSIHTRVDSSQGPVYFQWFGKASDSYFTGFLLSYFGNDEPTRKAVLFSYFNGIYQVRLL